MHNTFHISIIYDLKMRTNKYKTVGEEVSKLRCIRIIEYQADG